MSDRLRLRAQDADDLKVISALLQDALLPLADMTYIREERRFVMAVNRYRWDQPAEPSRTHALVSFQQVEAVRARGIDRRRPHHLLAILGITYGDGCVQIECAESGSVRLDVTALDCVLEDVGEPWPAAFQPKHEVD